MVRAAIALAAATAAYLVRPGKQEHFDIATASYIVAQGATQGPSPGRHQLAQPKLCDDTVQQHAGILHFANSRDEENDYFFWLFEAKLTNPKEAPLIVWMQGGPGCSSMLGLLTENGPCSVNDDGETTTLNRHSWHRKANVLWLEQPAGTGFSARGTPLNNTTDAADNVWYFLQTFMREFPQYAHAPIFVTGESYAGHFVPAVASTIFHRNKTAQAEGHLRLELGGFAIGNGLTDEGTSYKYYSDMLHTGGAAEGGSLGHGVVDDKIYRQMVAAIPECLTLIRQCNVPEATVDICIKAQEECNRTQMDVIDRTGLNIYDLRMKCEPDECYDHSGLDKFLNNPKTQKALGLPGNQKWQECVPYISTDFLGDWQKDLGTVIPELLENGVRAMIYAGDVDYICNWLGNKHFVTENLMWHGKEKFWNAADVAWTLEGKKVGRVRAYENLAFVQVHQAGHMVPMDQPAAAADMIESFIAGSWPGRKGAKEVEVTM